MAQTPEDVTPEMLAFAAKFNDALGKMKTASQTGTNCLLSNDETEAVLSYVQAVAASLRDLGLR